MIGSFGPPPVVPPPVASKARTPRIVRPFTVPHFRAWAADLILDSGESWHPEAFQEAFLADVFRGYAECWLVVPEGNGKTTLVAGLGLYHLEFRPYGAVPIAASSREQAEIMYRQAEGFVLRSPRLHEPVHSAIQEAKGKAKLEVPRFVCLEGYRRINHHGGGRIQVFASDDRTGDGIIPTMGIIDEVHRHRDLSLYRTWAGKLAKRDGQIVGISTAGEPGSDFELTRAKIRQAAGNVRRKGSFTRAAAPRLVLHEWAVPEGANVEDFRVVKRANPFSGITVPMLREKFETPTMTMAHWRRFVCNVPTRADNAAIQEREWEKARALAPIPEGEPIDVGLDVAWKWDTTAAVPLWVRDTGYRQLGEATILVPPRDGTSLDPHLVEDGLLRIHARNPIRTVVMDMSRAEQLAAWIESDIGAVVIDRSQSNVFAVQDYTRFMEALRGGILWHSGDPGLTRHVLNAIARLLPFGDARFDRPAEARVSSEQDRRVIDALTAAAMVNSFASVMETEPVVEPWVMVR